MESPFAQIDILTPRAEVKEAAQQDVMTFMLLVILAAVALALIAFVLEIYGLFPKCKKKKKEEEEADRVKSNEEGRTQDTEANQMTSRVRIETEVGLKSQRSNRF